MGVVATEGHVGAAPGPDALPAQRCFPTQCYLGLIGIQYPPGPFPHQFS